MSTDRNRLIAGLTFLAAVVIPLTAFLLTNRRALHIAWLFGAHELRAHRLILTTLALIVIMIRILPALARRRGIIILPLTTTLRHATGTARTIAVLTTLALLVGLYQYAILRYRVFSQVTYPYAALRAAREGRLVDARVTCEEYLRLYPQRRAGAALPDRTCVPLLSFTTAAAQLQRAIKATKPRPAAMDSMLLRVDWQARRETGQLLAQLAAGAAPPDTGLTQARPRPTVSPVSLVHSP